MIRVRIELWKYSGTMYVITIINEHVIEILERDNLYVEKCENLICTDSVFQFMYAINAHDVNEYYIMSCRYESFISDSDCELLSYIERGFIRYE